MTMLFSVYKTEKRKKKQKQKRTHKRNFSFHLGFSVCGRTEVALMNFAGTADEMLSRCSRLSFRLKLNRKLRKRKNRKKNRITRKDVPAGKMF